VSGHSKLAIASQEGEGEGEGEVEVSDIEMEIDDETVTPKKLESTSKKMIDFDLIDYEDLGLESIDIPPSTWISDDFSSSSTFFFFIGDGRAILTISISRQ